MNVLKISLEMKKRKKMVRKKQKRKRFLSQNLFLVLIVVNAKNAPSQKWNAGKTVLIAYSRIAREMTGNVLEWQWKNPEWNSF